MSLLRAGVPVSLLRVRGASAQSLRLGVRWRIRKDRASIR